MKPPDDRSDKEIDVLYQLCLGKQKPGDEGFFAKFLKEEGPAKLRQLLRLSYYEFVPKDHLVFEYKASGAEFFIILEGLVHFYSPNDAADEAVKKEMQRVAKEKEEPIDTSKPRTKSSYEGVPPTKDCTSSEVKRTTSGVHVYYNSRFIPDTDVMMKKEVFDGKPGANFGELALKGNKSGQQRRMSVLAAADCHFAVLNRTNYDVSSLSDTSWSLPS